MANPRKINRQHFIRHCLRMAKVASNKTTNVRIRHGPCLNRKTGSTISTFSQSFQAVVRKGITDEDSLKSCAWIGLSRGIRIVKLDAAVVAYNANLLSCQCFKLEALPIDRLSLQQFTEPWWVGQNIPTIAIKPPLENSDVRIMRKAIEGGFVAFLNHKEPFRGPLPRKCIGGNLIPVTVNLPIPCQADKSSRSNVVQSNDVAVLQVGGSADPAPRKRSVQHLSSIRHALTGRRRAVLAIWMSAKNHIGGTESIICLLYTSPSPRD